jgi:hypothetical protein
LGEEGVWERVTDAFVSEGTSDGSVKLDELFADSSTNRANRVLL